MGGKVSVPNLEPGNYTVHIYRNIIVDFWDGDLAAHRRDGADGVAIGADNLEDRAVQQIRSASFPFDLPAQKQTSMATSRSTWRTPTPGTPLRWTSSLVNGLLL